MKLNSTFYVLVFFMAALTLFMPFVTLAQQNLVPAEVVAIATRLKKIDV